MRVEAMRERQAWETHLRRVGQAARGRAQELALLPVLAIVILVGSITVDAFLTRANIFNILQQSSELAVVVVALSIALLAAKIDVSLESTVGLAPMVGAWVVLSPDLGGAGIEAPAWVGLIVLLAVGVAIGLTNAFLIVRLGLNAFVVTLAMLILLRGIHLGITNGGTLYDLPEEFTYLGNAEWGGVPVSVIFAGCVFLIFAFVLNRTRYGRSLYAIGGNPEAARAAGIRVHRVLWGTLTLSSLLAAIAGLMLTGRIGAVTPDQGRNMIFTAFAAAVIGGVSLNGGRATMLGALTGVILLGVVSNILILSQIPSFWIDAVYGGIIIAALILAKVSGRDDS